MKLIIQQISADSCPFLEFAVSLELDGGRLEGGTTYELGQYEFARDAIGNNVAETIVDEAGSNADQFGLSHAVYPHLESLRRDLAPYFSSDPEEVQAALSHPELIYYSS